jgi:hypothetical protein
MAALAGKRPQLREPGPSYRCGVEKASRHGGTDVFTRFRPHLVSRSEVLFIGAAV